MEGYDWGGVHCKGTFDADFMMITHGSDSSFLVGAVFQLRVCISAFMFRHEEEVTQTGCAWIVTPFLMQVMGVSMLYNRSDPGRYDRHAL